MGNAISIDPYSVPYITNEEGEKTWGPSLFSNYQNPIATAQIGRIDILENRISGGRYDLIQNRFFGTFYAQFKPWKFLTLKSQMGGKLDFDKYDMFREKYYIETNDYNPNSILYNRFINIKYWNWENTATFDHTFADKHHLTFLIGTTAENTLYTWVEAQNNAGRGLENDVPELRYFVYYTVDTSDAISGSGYENSLISYLGRLNYSFDNKYYITLSVRRDGSSKFGTSYEKNVFNKGRWATFPSFGVMWKASNESFFPKNNVLTSLKIRGGYGLTGNQNIGSYAYSATIDPQYARYIFDQSNNTIATGAFPYRGANDALHWETTSQTNIGIDAGFLKEKLTLTADFFIKKTSDMLSQPEIPMTVGLAEAPYQNLGDVKNTGVEASLGYRQVIGDFSFNLDGNVTYVKNKVTHLTSAVLAEDGFGDNDDPFIRIEEGYPIGYFWGYVTDGLFQNWDEVNASCQPGAAPGDVRFVDIDHDGSISTSDRTMIGNPIPEWTFGLDGQFNYKWFDLSIFFQGTYGNDVFFPWIRWIYDATNSGRNYHTDVLNAWTPDNTDSDVPRINSVSNENLRWSDLMVYDGSYLRLKTLEIGFTIPSNWAEKLTISNLRIYFNGTNLLTFTKYPWFDPEIGRTGREETAEGFKQFIYGVDYGLYPLSRAVIGGVQLSF
jgi:TonB-linked SusC/RagA family outer membrane protein